MSWPATARATGSRVCTRAGSRLHAPSRTRSGATTTRTPRSTTADSVDPSRPIKGPFYLWTNGQLVRVPGTTTNDVRLLVAASSRDRVHLVWERHSPTWDPRQQGIWTAESVRNASTGRWSIHDIR